MLSSKFQVTVSQMAKFFICDGYDPLKSIQDKNKATFSVPLIFTFELWTAEDNQVQNISYTTNQ